MADFKNIYRHLGSAKQWLNRAEEAFDKDHDIRGELNLLLAQAELQHVRESNRSRCWRYKYPLLRHGVALALAVIITSIGLGGAYWWEHQKAATVPVPVVSAQSEVHQGKRPEATPAAPLPPADNLRPAAADAPTTIPSTNSRPQAVERREATRPAEQADKEVVLSPAQMQELVRAAGKSLRGH